MSTETVIFDRHKLDSARRAKMFTKKGLARETGLDPSTVRRAARGLPVYLDTARLICERLGVTRDEVCKP